VLSVLPTGLETTAFRGHRYALEDGEDFRMAYLNEVLGPEDTRRLIGHAARLIGMQLHDETAALLDVRGRDAASFAAYLAALARAQGEDVEIDAGGGEARLRQRGWRLMAGVDGLDPAAFDAWTELWRGALAVHDRRLTLHVTPPAADGVFELRIGPGRAGSRR